MAKQTVKKPVTPAAGKTKARTSVDPFKTRKTNDKGTNGSTGDVVTPPDTVQEAIDAFRNAQDQAKFFEGEATTQKEIVNNFASEEYAKRVLTGLSGGFKLLGNEATALFVVQDASAGMSEEDVDAFREKHGDKAADTLIVKDFGSIRFNPEVLETHYEEIVKALQALPEDILSNLFKPIVMKAVPNAANAAKAFCKKPKEYEVMVKDLKLRAYIR